MASASDYLFAINPHITYGLQSDGTFLVGRMWSVAVSDETHPLPNWMEVANGLPNIEAAKEVAREWLECRLEYGERIYEGTSLVKGSKKSLAKPEGEGV